MHTAFENPLTQNNSYMHFFQQGIACSQSDVFLQTASWNLQSKYLTFKNNLDPRSV